MPSFHEPRPSRTIGLVAAATAVTLLTACATAMPPPTDQMTVAIAAVDAANRAGAQSYAPDPMKKANDKLAMARKSMSDKDYVPALRQAQQAQADAQVALSITQAAAARAAAQQATTDAAAKAVARPTDLNARPATGTAP